MIQEVVWMARHLKRKNALGDMLRSSAKTLSAWQSFWKDYAQYKKIAGDQQPLVDNLYPCLGDNTGETLIEPVYFYQDTWAFEKIMEQQPASHVDVGSHHMFVAFLSKILPLTMVDIRPLSLKLEGLNFREGSILALPFADQSVESLSSLCVVEHIGLGRYGDPLDPNGTEKALAELKRVLKPNGDLYLSLPLDDENKVFFNAHRAFQEEYLKKVFKPLEVVESRYIYGNNLLDYQPKGFGVGLYHLRLSDA
ncbi:DUF268 domain-containing protein [Pseudanabaena sp. FACHB-2040]|uniref:DUF268 domain-containing protein n=1 Tax=Pseudanabaena sp. FACHB-2040 TaxID=2692859 RepID=UPI0016872FC1|nr:DUF268 domain-containing protein [Pseudanabaena sp. FACHB-2040]MBD2260782.1 DUF268 domain-containing protein [Pseudanabaena sp. FACHB-2040]